MIPFVHVPDVATVAGVAADILFKSIMVIGLAVLAARFTARHNARVVMIWRMAFAALILLPVATLLVPSFTVGLVDLNHDVLDSIVASGSDRSSPVTWILLVWIAGALIGISRLTGDVRAARQLARSSVTVSDPRITELLEKALKITRVEPRPVLRETGALCTAALIGWQHPVVLLPTESRTWSDDELLGVLCHELEHLRHNDWIVLIL